MRKLKIGVFGGYRGKVMIEALLKHPDAELAAVCDKYVPILEEVKKTAAEFGTEVACFESFDEFIKYDLDAVVLANYATEHATFAIKCLNAGKHVMSEVLPSETLAQAIELIETVERTGLVYTYAENYCYMDNTFEMWRRYKEGHIGEVTTANCEYIHDCAGCWLDITYGDVNHWRNHIYPTFYCTHSLGPILAMTDRRPVQVVGFENPPIDEFYKLGHSGGHASGIEMVTLDNGATVRSIHGPLKKEPGHTNYELYGTKGYLASNSGDKVVAYREGEITCQGETETYKPVPFVAREQKESSDLGTHGGSDFYPTHLFIEKILGRPDGAWAIDVYKAVDMSICGILAFRSILQGNMPVKVPNFRNISERDQYRNDNACTNPDVAGESLLPSSAYALRELSSKEAAALRKQWEDAHPQ